MIAVIQRVLSAQVRVEDTIIGDIPRGALIYLGVEEGDTEKDMLYLRNKLSKLRIFPDQKGVMNRSIQDIGGSILLISQFTLCADTSRGNRPYYGGAARPEVAKQLYLDLGKEFEQLGIPVAYGSFGAHMEVAYTNDGPVTIHLSSRNT